MLGLDSLVATLLGGVSLLLVLRRLRSSRPSLTPKSVALVVLGDIGRSPRMLYHATSLASNGYTTHIVAYRGALPLLLLLPMWCSTHSLSPTNPEQAPHRQTHSPKTRTSASLTSTRQHPGSAPSRAPCSSSSSRSKSSPARGPSSAPSSPSPSPRPSSSSRCALHSTPLSLSTYRPSHGLAESVPPQLQPAEPTRDPDPRGRQARGPRARQPGHHRLAQHGLLGPGPPPRRATPRREARKVVRPRRPPASLCERGLTRLDLVWCSLELLFGRTAYAHLCVSDAMKAHLVQDAKLRCALPSSLPLPYRPAPGLTHPPARPPARRRGRVVTFHDRPPASFRRQTEQEAHEVRLFCFFSPFLTAFSPVCFDRALCSRTSLLLLRLSLSPSHSPTRPPHTSCHLSSSCASPRSRPSPSPPPSCPFRSPAPQGPTPRAGAPSSRPRRGTRPRRARPCSSRRRRGRSTRTLGSSSRRSSCMTGPRGRSLVLVLLLLPPLPRTRRGRASPVSAR